VDDIIAHLIPCENIGRLLHPVTVDKVLDSNDRYSYGLLMFQSSTWQGVAWDEEAKTWPSVLPIHEISSALDSKWMNGYPVQRREETTA
jgi:hypothetical protein